MSNEAWNARFGYLNLADPATIAASSSIPLASASVLQNPHVSRKWRSLGNSESLTIDLLSAVNFDAVVLLGLNLTLATGFTRVRASLTDVTGADGAVYNGTSFVGRVDPAYGKMVVLLPAAVSARYIRIDLSDATLAYIEAGRAVVTLTTQGAINVAPGASDTPIDPVVTKKGRGGQTFIDPSSPDPYRVLEFSCEFVSSTDRFGFVQEMDRLCGQRTDVLLIRDISSTNLGRDTIWGLLASTPVISPGGYLSDGLPAYSKSYKIEQRL